MPFSRPSETTAIFGLGYVGSVSAGCLASLRHHVIGVDSQSGKVDSIRSGRPPVSEPGLEKIVAKAVADGLISATTDSAEALEKATTAIVCVGTPSRPDGSANLSYVESVTAEIASAIRSGSSPCRLVIFRSTMLPGSTRRLVSEHLAELPDSIRPEVWFCPEFLREGTAIADFAEPSLIATGTAQGDFDRDNNTLPAIHREFVDPNSLMTWEEAELLKYSCNTFHALKVGFANEIGRLGGLVGTDGSRVMTALCRDTRLNISPAYLRPGAPFGGSCLPKDLSALRRFARAEGAELPIIEQIEASNQVQANLLIEQIIASGRRPTAILGLSFKADTDDLRNSPALAAAEMLLGRGFPLRIYEPLLKIDDLTGQNRTTALAAIPHLAELLDSSLDDALADTEQVVLGRPGLDWKAISETLASRSLQPDIIDLTGTYGI